MAKRTLAAATAVVLFASMPQSATVVSAQQMAISPSLPTTVLESGNAFPLVGLEMDGLATDELGHRISDAMQNTTQYGFFDISQRNQNERRLNAGIVNAVRSSNLYASEIHVITKVPYTHLGYERTKLSVKNALMELKNRNTHVHVQLEWPRCDDSISWMNCEQDEARLPAHVKAVGPPPHHSPETAFLESWRALEDIYLQEIRLGRDLPVVESIGVANFEVSDLQDLEMVSRVQPHILQKNVWSFIYDPFLLDYCQLHGIHFQVIDVISEIFGKGISPPRAIGALHVVAQALKTEDDRSFTPQQIVLKWLVQQGVSITTFAPDVAAVLEYSPRSLASIPDLTRKQQETVESVVGAMLRGQDLPPPMAKFHNRMMDGLLHLFWLNEATGEEVPVDTVKAGKTYVSTTYQGHKFIAYADDDLQTREQRYVMSVERGYGQNQHFLIKEATLQESASARSEL